MKPSYNEKRSRWQPAFLSGMLTLGLVSILVTGNLFTWDIKNPNIDVDKNRASRIVISFLAGMSGCATIFFLKRER
jgi:hypothetical protein